MKLQTLDDLYQLLNHDQTNRWMLILEVRLSCCSSSIWSYGPRLRGHLMASDTAFAIGAGLTPRFDSIVKLSFRDYRELRFGSDLITSQ